MTKTKAIGRWLAISAAVAMATIDVAASQRWFALLGSRARASTSDNICGPRCVQLVLQRYGRVADLVELVREIQFPNVKSGASLGDMRRLIEREGIFTAAISAPAGYSLRWPYPSVAYLPRRVRTGHFVVIVDDAGERRRLATDGIADVRDPADAELLACSYTILATSPDEISLADVSRHLHDEGDVVLLAFSLLITVGVLAIAAPEPNQRGGRLFGAKTPRSRPALMDNCF